MLNSKHEEIFRRCMDIPKARKAKMARANAQVVQRQLDSMLKVEIATRKKRERQLAPVFGPLRSELARLPGAQEARQALRALHKKKERGQLNRPKVPAHPKHSPMLPGSLLLFADPPFNPEKTYVVYPTSSQLKLTADPTGYLYLWLHAGYTYGGHTLMCHVGFHETIIGDPLMTLMDFSVAPSYFWKAHWSSGWWALAAGDIRMGIIINRFDQNANFLDNRVNSWKYLVSFHDTNLADAGDLSGENSSDLMMGRTLVDANSYYVCSVAFRATAYGEPLDSVSILELNGVVDFMSFRLYGQTL
jgi:hypothetical protein